MTTPANYLDFQQGYVARSQELVRRGVDVCQNPQAVCEVPELRFASGFFYWTRVVQESQHFEPNLNAFVDSGFNFNVAPTPGSNQNFATGVGAMVNNGNWVSVPHGNEERLLGFRLIVQALRDAGMRAN